MDGLKKLLIGVLVIAGLIGVTPLVFPYERYKPGLEATLKQRLEIDVKLGDIAFSYSPVPQLTISSITMGNKGEGSIGRASIPINVKNLLNFRKELNDLLLEDARFQQAFALSLPGRLKPNPGGRDIHLASFKIRNLNIGSGDKSIGPASAVVVLKQDGTFKEITFSDATGNAELNIKPVGDKFAMAFDAHNWVLPGKYPVRFEQVLMKGVADENGVLIDEINGLIFANPALGQAQLTWGAEWKLSGNLETRSMQAEPLITTFSPITYANGRIALATQFQFVGTSYETLFQNPLITGKFTISDGAMHNFDLVTPLKSSNPSSLQRGGQTRFDTLSGDMTYDAAGVAVKNIALNSGKFTAVGSVSVAPDMQMTGRMSARLKSGIIMVEAPMTIDGTLEAPQIHSSGSFKPGDASGTTRVF